MYIMSCLGSGGGRLTGPLISLSLVGLALLTGINRVAEYRNHWSDVVAGQAIGVAVAVFLVSVSLIFRAVSCVSDDQVNRVNSDTSNHSSLQLI